jgi:hypothetical protein
VLQEGDQEGHPARASFADVAGVGGLGQQLRRIGRAAAQGGVGEFQQRPCDAAEVAGVPEDGQGALQQRPRGGGNEIMASHVREWVTDLQAKGVSPATIQKVRFILSAIFTTALNDVTYLHPCKGVRTPTVPKK